MKAAVRQFEPECVLPVDAPAHGIGGLAVAQMFEKLKYRDQSQPPGRQAGLAATRVERLKVLVPVEVGKLVAQARDDGAEGKSSAGNAHGLGGNFANPGGVKAHAAKMHPIGPFGNSPTVSHLYRH